LRFRCGHAGWLAGSEHQRENESGEKSCFYVVSRLGT
jgi:hypothetical protein